MPVRDVLIVGAGPSGLATAIAAKRQGLDYRHRREGRAGQFDLQLSDAHGVLHHAGAARDRRPAARHARTTSRRGSRRCATTVASSTPTRLQISFHEDGGRHRARTDDGVVRRDAPTGHARASTRERARPRRRAGHRLLRPAQLPGRARRGPAARVALLHRRASLLPSAGRRRRREELGRRGLAGAVSRRRARHAGASARRARRLDQVLGAARHREPDQGRVDCAPVSSRASSRLRRPQS